jgi:hypothetical protein
MAEQQSGKNKKYWLLKTGADRWKWQLALQIRNKNTAPLAAPFAWLSWSIGHPPETKENGIRIEKSYVTGRWSC